MATERCQFSYGHTIAGHDEPLATVQLAHDLAALIPKLSLSEFSRHTLIVALRATCMKHVLQAAFDRRVGGTPDHSRDNAHVAESNPSNDWDASYSGAAPPWDIGRPQPAVVQLAEAGAFVGTFLDAGCGTGEHSILASRHGAQSLGIDVSPRAIEIAQRKATENKVELTFQVHDARHLDTLGYSFDTILDCGLFHVFDELDRSKYVVALHGVLRPGGHLYLMCFSDSQPGDWGPRRIAEDELRAAFGSGWRFDSVARNHFDINPVGSTTIAEAWLADIVRLARQ